MAAIIEFNKKNIYKVCIFFNTPGMCIFSILSVHVIGWQYTYHTRSGRSGSNGTTVTATTTENVTTMKLLVYRIWCKNIFFFLFSSFFVRFYYFFFLSFVTHSMPFCSFVPLFLNSFCFRWFLNVLFFFFLFPFMVRLFYFRFICNSFYMTTIGLFFFVRFVL